MRSLHTPSSVLLVLTLVAGCGASVTEPDPGPDLSAPHLPARPTIDAHGPSKTFAADHVFLGTTLRSGVVSSKAWESFGVDLDGRVTGATESRESRGVCRRSSKSPGGIMTDGAGGVDNNVGSQLVPVLKSLKPDFEEETDGALRAGEWTWVLVLEDLGGDDDAKVPGRLYLGRKHPGVPTFSAADRWPVLAEVVFPDGYTREGTWVSGRGSFALPLVMRHSMRLELEGAFVTLRLADGVGLIAGAVRAPALRAALTPTLRQYGVCPGYATYEQITTTVDEAADLVAGAPLLQDPAKACDALSLGFGFHATPTGAPTPLAAEPSEPAPSCP